MKNKFYFVYYFLIINLLLISPIFGSDQFNFEITEIEIKEKGNKIYGYKRGEINTDSKIKLQQMNLYMINKLMFYPRKEIL